MKKSQILIPLLSLLALSLFSQSPIILPNPSFCYDLGVIRDFTCPSNSGYYDPNRFVIRVIDAPGTALGTDVYLKEVRLIVQHTWVADLEIRLVSPGGKSALLTADNGGGENNYGVPAFRDCGSFASFSMASCDPIPPTGAPYISQPYLPQESFYVFNDSVTNPVGDWTLLICDDTEQDSGRLHFVELVFEPIECLPVTGIQVLEQDTTSLVLEWFPADGCAQAQTYLEYGPKGFTPGAGSSAGPQGTVVLAGCPPFVLTSLAPDSDYDIYLRKTCGPGRFSGNSCPLGIRTACLPPGPSAVEEFDQAGNSCSPLCGDTCSWEGIWKNDAQGTFDWILYSGKTPTQGTGPSAGVSGAGKYVYLEASGNQCQGEAILSSGCFQLNKRGSDACHFSFYYHMWGPNTGSLKLEVSQDGVRWDSLWQQSGDQGDSWHKAYLSLSPYPDGATLQFRFTGKKGSGPLGDIALDRIAVHGSVYLGPASVSFYADADGDGYGNPDRTVWLCAENPPAGYVRQSGDCNDQDAGINPAAAEVPCDGIDNNCNGMEDDVFLPAPLVISDTICSGDLPVLQASPVLGDFVLWYAQPVGGDGIAVSELFYPDIPPSQDGGKNVYRFYAEAVDAQFRCFSSQRAEAVVVVNPLPEGSLAQEPGFCPGTPFDLGGLVVQDAHLTGAVASFHTGLPATPMNRLSSTIVQPEANQTYAFLLTSPDGCTDSDTFVLVKRQPPSLKLLPSDSFSICTGSARDIQVVASAGAGGYRYIWSNGSESPQTKAVAGPTPGTRLSYAVRVTDSLGCAATDSLLVYTISSIDSLRRQVVDVSACNAANGQLILTPLDGVPPFSYRWEGSQGVAGDSLDVATVPFILTGLAQGAYRVTITDQSNEQCAFIMPPVIVNGPAAGVRDITIQPVTCAGASSGSICIQLTGNGNPTFLWSNGDTTACTGNLAGGLYSVTISENGCVTVLKDLVVSEASPLKILAETSPASCHNSRDASIRLAVFGGGGGYQYRWNNGFLLKDLQGILPGTYSVTVTDVDGCTLAQSIQAPAPAPLAIYLDSLSDIRCNGEENGTLLVSGQGGVPPYQLKWSDGNSAPYRSQLGKGNYALSITDFNRCTAERTFTIQEPAALSVSIELIQPPRCQGDTSGVLEARASGGTGPYLYFWNTGAVASRLDRVGTGDYWVLARDANGCTSDTAWIRVETLSRLDWNASVAPPLCSGRSNGAIELMPQGSGPFQFHWENGETTATLEGVPEGTYSVQVIDAQGCEYDTTFELKAAETPIQIGITAIPPSCSGGGDGLISLQPLQVIYPPLKYVWENGFREKDRKGLKEGLYSVAIEDGAGCKLVLDSLALLGPPPLRYELIAQGEIVCQGDSTGFLELAVSGGAPPYSYVWKGATAQTPSVYNLKAGQYQVFIQDQKGCPLNASFRLTEPEAIDIAVDVRIGNICLGDTTNQLKADITGGAPPYTLRWSNGKSDPVLNNVTPGDYFLAVRDGNGCQKLYASAKVRDRGKPLALLNFQALDISCFGERDGRLSASVSGGTPPYTYFFGGTSSIIKTNEPVYTLGGLGPDSKYYVVVSDGQGCQVQSDLKPIREPSLLSVRRDSIKSVACSGTNTGAIFVTASGGTRPYAFNWFEMATGREVATTEDLVSFRSGTYRLVVTDARLCSDTLSAVTIPSKTAVKLDQVAVTPLLCKGDSTGAIQVVLSGGRAPYRIFWNGVPGTAQLSKAKAGAYELAVVDSDSCRTVFPLISISEPAEKILVGETVFPSSCLGRPDGGIEVTVQGGLAPYQLVWRDGAGKLLGVDTPKIGGLPKGDYDLMVTDSNRCVRHFLFRLPETPPLHLRFEVSPPSGAQPDGAAQAVVEGGTPPYRYIWNTGDTTALLDSVPAGVYTLAVADSRLCGALDSVRVVPVMVRTSHWVRESRLYPNPASTVVRWELDLINPLPSLEWRMHDAYGREVLYGTLPKAPRIVREIPVEGLPSGWYSLSLRSAGVLVWVSPLLIGYD
ncbi:MAG: hypothetical protein KIPDCIKN_00253 [Haliscomenobacter sp.]|jgi:hypothetical protein|nr:hypothetical protein [Haliscomenobacter sp.]